MKTAKLHSDRMQTSPERRHLRRSLALIHSMIVQVMSIKVCPKLDDLALTVEAHDIHMLVDELFAYNAPPIRLAQSFANT